MNERHPLGVVHSFSIKNIFYYKMELQLCYFHVTTYSFSPAKSRRISLSLIKGSCCFMTVPEYLNIYRHLLLEKEKAYEKKQPS